MKIKLDGKWWEVIGDAEIYEKQVLCPIRKKAGKGITAWLRFFGGTYLDFTIRVGSSKAPLQNLTKLLAARSELCVHGLKFCVSSIKIFGSGTYKRANVICRKVSK